MLGRIIISLDFPTSAPRSAVWAALEAAPLWPDVQPDLAEARIDPDGVLAPGATIRTRAKPGTRAVDMTYRVLEAEKPRRLAIETAVALHFRARTEYLIEADGEGARVILTSRIDPVHWLHKITTALERRWYTEQMTNNLKARIRPLLMLAERMAFTEPAR